MILFSDFSERNNNYTYNLDFKMGWVAKVGWSHFSLWKSLIKSAMLIYFIWIRTHDTGRRLEPIFLKFTELVRVHPWVNRIVFENNRPNRTTNIGENVPPKPFFDFHSAGVKWLCLFLSPMVGSFKKSMLTKIIFRGYFGNYCFFSKKLLNEKYSKSQRV